MNKVPQELRDLIEPFYTIDDETPLEYKDEDSTIRLIIREFEMRVLVFAKERRLNIFSWKFTNELPKNAVIPAGARMAAYMDRVETALWRLNLYERCGWEMCLTDSDPQIKRAALSAKTRALINHDELLLGEFIRHDKRSKWYAERMEADLG